ncbi:MAG: heparinase II/III family protein [Rhodothermia bacterium]
MPTRKLMTDPTRRDILKLAALASTGFLPSTVLLPTTGSGFLSSRWDLPEELALELFFGGEALPAMRWHYLDNPVFEEFRASIESIDRKEERRFIADEVRYNDQLFDIIRLSRLAENMAFHYLMTGDQDAADLSAEAIRSIMKFDRWDYFLEDGTKVVGIQRASSTAIGVSVAADWLGSHISDEERRRWLTVMIERGNETTYLALYGMRYPDTVKGWTRDESSTYFEHRPDGRADLSRRHIIINSTNLKAVPSAALAISGTACLKYFGSSDDVERWLEMATYSLGTFRDYFEPDGSYAEGVSYGFYTATQLTQASTVLARAGRAELDDFVNWPGYVDYFLNMVMPTSDDPYEIVNFGDNGNPKSGQAGKPRRSAVPFWIASRYRDGAAQTLGEDLAGGHNLWSLVWYDETVSRDRLPAGPHLWHSDLDWMVVRTGFEPVDLVVAMRSGGPANHEHADRNSIIVKCFGEQLVTDPYRPPYSYSDPSWMMRTTAGHSAVLVDGKGHQYVDGKEGTNSSEAWARIVQSGLRDGYSFWTSDATQAYALVNPEISWVARTIVVTFDDPAILVVDRLETTGRPMSLTARFFGYNYDGNGTIEAGADRFVVRRPGALAVGASFSPGGAVAEVGRLPIPAERSDRHPFVDVATGELSNNQTLVTLLRPTLATDPEPPIDFVAGDSGCLVSSRDLSFEVSWKGQIPRVGVR